MRGFKIDHRTATLVGLLTVIVISIVWVSHAENEAIRLHLPPVLPEPTTVEGIKLTDWISAIGTAVGAVLTAGALLIAAFTYRHQVDEKNRQAEDRRRQAEENKRAEDKAARAQAVQVSLVTADSKQHTNYVVLELINSSSSPIKNVLLMCFDHKGQQMGQALQQVIAGGQSLHLERPRRVVDKAWARFQDAENRTWKVYVNGDLEPA
ncbi:hypothetical protein [Pseudarthrobacter sp. 1C304]|uniref:hypothetical protein n=1 Tax=Pseudarthrobacter sp. 1C304 TaxID=3457438 RepID=UPI003FD3A640